MITLLLAWLERRRRFRVARSYNGRYTFRVNGPYAGTWMCPTCCTVHRAHSSSKFSGPQFDACCGFNAGGRMERRHAIRFTPTRTYLA